MAKFCKYCGKQLEDGEACSCGGASDTVKKQAKGIWYNFSEFVKNPVSAGTEFVQQRNIRNSLIIIGVYACLLALFVVSILGKYNDFIKNVFMTRNSMMESSIYEQAQTNVLITSISFPLTTAFFVIAITIFAVKCILPLALMLGIKLFKGETDYAYMLCVSGVKSLTLAPFFVLAVIISFFMPVNITFAALEDISLLSSLIPPFVVPIFIAVLGKALSNYIALSVIHGGSSVSKDKIPYVMFIAGILMAIVTVIAIRITFPMTLPTVFKQLYNAFQSGGFETFLNAVEDIF